MPFKMFQNIQNNKMAKSQVAAAIIAVLLLDDDDIKKRGKKHFSIKKAKTEVARNVFKPH